MAASVMTWQEIAIRVAVLLIGFIVLGLLVGGEGRK